MLDMYDSYYKEIEEYYKNNYIIIFDRYWYSNIYYQGTTKLINNYSKKQPELNSSLAIDDFYYKEFEDYINKLNDDNFKLPKANLIYKMIHNIIPSRTIIEQRKESDSSHNDVINESKYKYLDKVNLSLKKYPFRYGEKIFKQYIITLDKNKDHCKSEEEIFEDIKTIFNNSLKEFMVESE